MGVKPETTRDRILQAAEKIFSEKGYDAARIDEVAARAGVNKALIYYYFKGKRAVLHELFQRFFRESARLLVSYVEHGGLDTAPPPDAAGIFESYFAYFERKRDLLRIMVMESLKPGKEAPPLFKLVDFGGLIDDTAADRVRRRGLYPKKEMQQTLVAEFFTGVVPMLCYILFREQWTRHFGVPADALKGYFNRAMEMTHEAYHRVMRDEWSEKGSP